MTNRTKSANEARAIGQIAFSLHRRHIAALSAQARTDRADSEFRSSRDSEGSRIAQERIDLVVLERRIEGDLVVVLLARLAPQISTVHLPSGAPRPSRAFTNP